jgi:hypothetical protein
MIDFNETEYLALYPDVAEAVRAGAFKSAYEYYLKHGKKEGRAPSFATSMTPREQAVFHLIDRAGLGLETAPHYFLSWMSDGLFD